MPLGDFAEAGIIPKPLPLGRAARFLFGAGALFYFIWNTTQLSELVSHDVPAGGYFIGLAVAWWYLPDLFAVGLSLRWGRWPQAAVLPIALALVVADIVAYESGWAPPLGWGLFLLTEGFFGFIGASFLLAAILAVPG